MTENIPQLTFTRFIAAMAVVVFHYGKQAFPFQTGFLHALAQESGITVSYFFFLSGFLLCFVYNKPGFSARNFFAARAGRILPLYFLGFILAIFCVYVLGPWPWWKGAIVAQAFLVHAWIPGMPLTINYPAWSVSVEAFFYVMFPLLLLIARKSGTRNFILLAVFLWALSIAQNYLVQKAFYDPSCQQCGDFIMYFPPWHLNTFISGMAAGLVFLQLRGKIKTTGPLPLFIALAGIACIIPVLVTDNPIKHLMHSGMLAPFYAMIVLGFSLDKTIIARVMSFRPMQFLGEISYGIYLLQFPVWFSWDYFTKNTAFKLESTPGFYLVAGTLLIVSGLSYHYIEKPARIYIRNRFQNTKAEKL